MQIIFRTSQNDLKELFCATAKQKTKYITPSDY